MVKKKRVQVPARIRDAVLREFNFRCAICGTSKPTMHHVDEDPGNNSSENLLPLCPNCHYSDQHDPTSPMDSRKLKLFRRFKDPIILSPEFEPLFRRVVFLLTLDESSFETKAGVTAADDLANFVTALEMGDYYGKTIAKLVAKKNYARAYGSNTPKSVFREWDEEERKEYFEKLEQVAEQILELIVELLRYQPWRQQTRRDSSSAQRTTA